MSVSDFDLRFALKTERTGSVEFMYFRSPRDAEGVLIRLTALEAAQLSMALTTVGFHPLARDDSPELKIYEPAKKKAA